MKFLLSFFCVFFVTCCFAQKDTTVLLDGSQSLHTDSYFWRQIDGQPVELSHPDSVKCYALKLGQGRFEFELTCTNEFGSDKDSVIITVIKNTLGITQQIEQLWRRPEAITDLEIRVANRSSDLMIQIKSPRTQEIDCRLYDITGRALAQVKIFVKKGVNYMTIPKPKISGIYILNFVSYFENVTKMVII